MENQNIMQKMALSLSGNEVVEINGAIVGLEIVDMLRYLQLGIETGSYYTTPNGENGIDCFEKDYDDLTIFLASEAGNIEDKRELAAFLCSISYMKRRWDNFRNPFPIVPE